MQQCPAELLEFRYKYVTEGGTQHEYFYSAQQSISLTSYVMACCGASSFEHLYTNLYTDKKKQDFLTVLTRQSLFKKSFYYIITNKQYREFGGKDSFIKFLESLGSKMIDETPNRNHIGNNIQMWRWCPEENAKLIDDIFINRDYVKLVDGRTPCNPKWWVDLTDAQRAEHLQKYPPMTLEQYYAKERENSRKRQLDQIKQMKNQLNNFQRYNPDLLKDFGWTPTQSNEQVKVNPQMIFTTTASR